MYSIVYGYISLQCNIATLLRDLTCHIASLRGEIPTFTAAEAGTRFSDIRIWLLACGFHVPSLEQVAFAPLIYLWHYFYLLSVSDSFRNSFILSLLCTVTEFLRCVQNASLVTLILSTGRATWKQLCCHSGTCRFDNCNNLLLTTTTLLHPFNGPLSGTTRVSQYQKGKTNLDFTEARDSEWQWH